MKTPTLLVAIVLASVVSAHRVSVVEDSGDLIATAGLGIVVEIPKLGRFGKQYQVFDFVGRGGQAEVWKGYDRTLKKMVILRFPLSLCDEPVCRVDELHPDTVAELAEGCELASAALNRFTEFERMLDSEYKLASSSINGDNGIVHAPCARCLQAVSRTPTDPAFEVWSFAGNSTLAEEFFLGDVSMDTKRQVLAQLKLIMASLGHGKLTDEPCCCTKSFPSSCVVQPELSKFDYYRGRLCPKEYKLQPGRCGPIVHHDFKFDNVMIQRSSTGKLSPVVIDFGAAALCSEGRAHGFSRDWVPYWIQSPEYDTSVSNAECSGYDLFAVGLAWLVTELLKDLGSMTLICKAADALGLTRVSTQSGKLPDLTIEPLDDEADGDARGQASSDARGPRLTRLASIDDYDDDADDDEYVSRGCRSTVSFAIDADLKKTALQPVHALVHELRTQLLHAENFESENVFVDALRSFLGKNETEFAEDVRGLHLVMPNETVLARDIYPLLQVCPSPLAQDTPEILRCRLDAASRRLKEALKDHQLSLIPRRLLQYKTACSRMSGECSGDESAAIFVLITNNHVESVRSLFSDLPEKEKHRLANMMLDDGETLLAMAAQSGLTAIVNIFLQNGADPLLARSGTASSSDMPLPALLAAAKKAGNIDVLRMLLHHVIERIGGSAVDVLARLHAVQRRGLLAGPSLLSITAESGDVEMLALVLDTIRHSHHFQTALNPSADARLGIYTTPVGTVCHIFGAHVPLFRAASAGKAEACQILIDAGADLKIADRDGSTALSMAVSSGNLATVQIVGAASRNLSAMNLVALKVGAPLHLAVAGGVAEIVEALLSFDADPGLKNSQGDTPLHIAIGKQEPSLQIVEILAKSNKAQTTRNREHETPLITAARQCKRASVIVALVRNASAAALRTTAGNGYTALHWAAHAGQLACLEALIKHAGIDSFGPSMGGQTALMAAAEKGQVPSMQLLMAHSAKSYAFEKDGSGRPLAISVGWQNIKMRFGRIETLQALVDLTGPAILEEQDFFGISVLGRWVYDGDQMAVSFLIDSLGADCNATFRQSADVSKAAVNTILGPLGPVNRWTPLKLVRRRMESLLREKSSGDFPGCQASARDLRLWSYMGAWCTGKPTRVRLFHKLHRVQNVLEKAQCDGQDSVHVSSEQWSISLSSYRHAWNLH
eukprot:TRINITY_DN1598_c1_g1_i1.p1 TRINITY_DN1598_c1_g1~~TRINITY_DN1598_c1_g1_i1.p1  ORF type:complete len:1178 (+),score=172.74 TRINITY_DN1598_c1_g1_i1:33-3566(+)